MKQNGFISSALLYGMLALFLVIMTSTLAILAHQKLGMDKLKENALVDIQYGYAKTENIKALYDGFIFPTGNKLKDQSGNNADAILYNFQANQYSNHHINFNGNSYLDTGIKQNTLGNAITFSTVINLKDVSGVRGLWGYSDSSAKTGIYAHTNNGKINICAYAGSNPLCIEIGSEFINSYLNKIIQLTVVMESQTGIDIYVNNISYDRIGTTQNMNLSSGSLIIGKWQASDTNMMIADLYNFTIYNTALTYDDVMQNFEANSQKYNIAS